MNPNDHIRQQILEWFHSRNSNATSHYGKSGTAIKIGDVKRSLKEAHDLSQQQVMSNLTYLIDKGWINRTEIKKTIQVSGGTVPSTTTWYEISSAGIDKIEGHSEFKQGGKYAGINITASGANIIAMGDGNVVNAEFKDLHTELSNLKRLIISSSVSESEKLDAAVDIESLKEQLAKTVPDKTIIDRLWSKIQEIAILGGATDAISKITPQIAALLP